VSDGFLLSGLSNCGYVGSEDRALRERWEADVNEHGLFSEAGPARRFADETNVRVPEHAPFFPFGIYLVRRVG
jgi:hypothetical protein